MMITIAKASASRRSRAQARTSRRIEAPADEPGTPSVVAGGVRLGNSSIFIHKLYLYHARAPCADDDFSVLLPFLQSVTLRACDASHTLITIAYRILIVK